jgi:hypothetical protein
MKTKIANFIALSLILFSSFALNMNMKFKTRQDCFVPDPNTFRFDNRWKLGPNGGGEIKFQGVGRDVYIKLHNNQDNNSFQYFLILNGWDNTRSMIQRTGGAEVCFPFVAGINLSAQNDFRITLNPKTATIAVYINGALSFACNDPNGWNADGAKWFSVSRYSGANFQFCNLSASNNSDDCFVPNPSTPRFDRNWTLGQNGGGEIKFRGTGRDVYIRLHNNQDNNSLQYFLILNGWDNTRSMIQRTGGAEVCFPFVKALDLSKMYDYRIVLNPLGSTISVYIDGQLSFTCNDPNGWNAQDAKFYSVSRYSGANYLFCGGTTDPLTDDCYSPNPNTFKHANQYTLGPNGGGEILFKGTGRDVYIKLNNNQDNNSFQYFLILNGWDNTKSMIQRTGGAEVCFPNVRAVDLNKQINWRIVLNPATSTISVYTDDQFSFSCVDPNGWNAQDAKYFSVSRYSGASFFFCDGKSLQKPTDDCFTPNPNTFKFDRNWTMGPKGSGEITFRGVGRDVYIKIHNNQDNNSNQYFLVLNGWDNTRSRIERNGAEMCFPFTKATDLGKFSDYKIQFSPETATISVFINGELSFACTDYQGWNANDAKFFSISRYSGANFHMCGLKLSPLQEQCFVPDPNTFKFQDNWTLGQWGSGEIKFKGVGRDVYIKLNNNKDNNSHQYFLILNGWDNTKSRIARGDNSEICFPNVAAVDLNKQNEWRVVLDADAQKISVYVNGTLSFSCTDWNGWYANQAKYYSISRYSGAFFHYCGMASVTPVVVPKFDVTGEIINATTGKKITPLNGAIITITDSASKTYPVDIDSGASKYSAKVPAGQYVIKASATGFINASIDAAISANDREDIFLSPVVTDQTTRIVLKWNELSPMIDLDIYGVNTKDNNDRVWWKSKNSPSGKMTLDVDNVKSGPETITVKSDAKDTIQILVSRFDSPNTPASVLATKTPITGTGATISIYRGNQQVAAIAVPSSGAGRGWEVGTYNPADGSFVLSNKIIA